MFRLEVVALSVTWRQIFRLWVLNLKPNHRFPGSRCHAIVLTDASDLQILFNPDALIASSQQISFIIQRRIWMGYQINHLLKQLAQIRYFWILQMSWCKSVKIKRYGKSVYILLIDNEITCTVAGKELYFCLLLIENKRSDPRTCRPCGCASGWKAE